MLVIRYRQLNAHKHDARSENKRKKQRTDNNKMTKKKECYKNIGEHER